MQGSSPSATDTRSSVLNFSLQAKIQSELKELRNKSVFFFSVFNALFVLIVFMLTLHKDTLHIDWPFGIKENITITEDEQVKNGGDRGAVGSVVASVTRGQWCESLRRQKYSIFVYQFYCIFRKD